MSLSYVFQLKISSHVVIIIANSFQQILFLNPVKMAACSFNIMPYIQKYSREILADCPFSSFSLLRRPLIEGLSKSSLTWLYGLTNQNIPERKIRYLRRNNFNFPFINYAIYTSICSLKGECYEKDFCFKG
jgi:hypothetical protein